MTCIRDSRTGLDGSSLLLEKIDGLDGVAWRYSGLLESSSIKDPSEFVATFRRVAKILPLVLGRLDGEFMWVLRVVREDAGGSTCKTGSHVLVGHFVLSGMVDYSVNEMPIDDGTFHQALHGAWPHSVEYLTRLTSAPKSLAAELGGINGQSEGTDLGVTDASDNLYRLLLVHEL